MAVREHLSQIQLDPKQPTSNEIVLRATRDQKARQLFGELGVDVAFAEWEHKSRNWMQEMKDAGLITGSKEIEILSFASFVHLCIICLLYYSESLVVSELLFINGNDTSKLGPHIFTQFLRRLSDEFSFLPEGVLHKSSSLYGFLSEVKTVRELGDAVRIDYFGFPEKDLETEFQEDPYQLILRVFKPNPAQNPLF